MVGRHGRQSGITMPEPLTVTVEHPKPDGAQEINDQLADLFAVEVARLVMRASNQKPESLNETAENMTAFLCSLSTGHKIQAHPITEEDRRLCRIRYTITEPPQPQRVTVNVTTEKS
jgi:hypothetical protein